jgi:hypothetical protein
MSSGGNFVVPGVPGSGGAIQSINNLVGAITFNSPDETLNVVPDSATNITITNPTLVLHFSGTTDASGTYTNMLGDDEGYVMLDTTYSVAVTQTSAPTGAPIILYVSQKTTGSVSIMSMQNNTTPEPNVSFDAILVATNFRKAVPTPTSFTFPATAVQPSFSVPGGGDPFNFGYIPTGSNVAIPGNPSYINPSLNSTINISVRMAGQMTANDVIGDNTLLYGIYGPGLDNFLAGFSMDTIAPLPLPINNGVGIPPVSGSNFIGTGTIPYSYLTSTNSMYYGLFLSFPCAPNPSGSVLDVDNLQYQLTYNYISYQ